ncbi:MAG: ABC transporter ATP-binding protein [Butyribacter sp.]|nr:ABC transporter ATP-binding protein [bacterium]MDY3855035.1 ABC transporter ATP-binding protein [Butyribacter sp.]
MQMTTSEKKHHLKIENVAKSFQRGKKKVLTNVQFEAFGGECIGILGANGCGKSTLLSILSGIQTPDSGSITLDGEDILSRRKKKDITSSIGYVPQECPLMEELTAYDNLKLWYCDSPLALEEELSDGFLAMLGIPDFLHVTVHHMSGGMKKRLSIGCSIAQNPYLLLLDEPGAALDLICKERIEVYLKNYKKQGNIILLATHEEREIAMCDRIYILKDGALVPFSYDGNIHTLVSHFI